MTKVVQMVRGPTSSMGVYPGRAGQITVNTDIWAIRVHDGVTPGGYSACMAQLNLADVLDPAVARNNLGAAPIAIPDFVGGAAVDGDTVITQNAIQAVPNKDLSNTTAFTAVKNINAQTLYSFTNPSAGNSAAVAVTANNNVPHYAGIEMFSNAFTPAGSVLPDSMRVSTDGGGGLVFETTNGGTSQRWWTAGAQRMVLDANGVVNINRVAPIAGEKLSVGGSINASGPIITGPSVITGQLIASPNGPANNNIGTPADYSGYLNLISWNFGAGFAIVFITNGGVVTTISSSNALGGNNCFDIANNFASNGGNGVAFTYDGAGSVLMQTKNNWTGGGNIKITRLG